MVKLNSPKFTSLNQEFYEAYNTANNKIDMDYLAGYYDSLFWNGTIPSRNDEFYIMGWEDAQGDYRHYG